MEMERTSTSYACRSLLLGRLTKRLAWRRHRIRFLAVEGRSNPEAAHLPHVLHLRHLPLIRYLSLV